jgi:hypothetical protein
MRMHTQGINSAAWRKGTMMSRRWRFTDHILGWEATANGRHAAGVESPPALLLTDLVSSHTLLLALQLRSLARSRTLRWG